MRFLLIIFGSLFVQVVAAQPFNFTTYREANGLPSGYIESAMEDSRGYLWLSTFGGMSRFDGQHFVNYGVKEGLPSNLVDFITEDKRGRLWITTRKGISIFNGKTFKTFPYLPDTTATTFYNFTNLQEDGNIHTAIYDKLYRAAGDTLIPEIPEPGFKDSMIRNRGMLKNGIKVISTYNTIYILYPSGKKRTITGLSEGYIILNFQKKPANSFCVLASTGVYRWENDTLTRVSTLQFKNQILTAVFEDEKKRIWTAAEGKGVKIINTVTGAVDSLNDLPILVTSFYQDRQKTIWISTFRGLVKVTEGFISHYTTANGLTSDDIRGAGKLDNESIYLGSNIITNGRLQQYPAAVKKTMTNSSFFGNVACMAKTGNGNTWIFTYTNRSFIYNGTGITEQTAKTHGLFIGDAFNDKYGGPVWLAAGKRIYGLQGDSIHILFDRQQNGTAFKNVKAVKKDNWGNTWINDGGSVLLKKGDLITNVTARLQLPANVAAEMCYSDSSGWWFTTAGYGAIHLKHMANGSMVKNLNFNKENGLVNDNVLSITTDKNNFLWIASYGGLCYIDLNKTVNGKHIVHYVHQDEGLDVPNWNLAYLQKDNEGNVWLGVSNGIYKIDIERLPGGTLAPDIHINNISIANDNNDWKNNSSGDSNYFGWPQHHIFKHDQNNISFFFKGINLKNGQVSYSYILKGQDKEWITGVNTESITYNNLPPGKYSFMVKAINDDGIESAIPATFKFEIWPPFWQTWWFRFIIGITCVALIYIFVKQRDKNASHKNDLQLQMSELRLQAVQSQMNPHFIFNSLNSIQNYIVQNNQIEAARYLSRFSKLIRRILDNSHHRFLKPEDILETLKMYVELEAFRFNNEFTYSFHLDTSDERIHEVELPPMLLQPYVENAILHGLMPKEGDKHLSVSLFIEEDTFICIIEDNGKGRTPKENSSHISRGEKLTQSMLESISTAAKETASVTYHDLKDNNNKALGTKLVIRIPVAKI